MVVILVIGDNNNGGHTRHSKCFHCLVLCAASQVSLGSDKGKFAFEGPSAPPLMEVMSRLAALEGTS